MDNERDTPDIDDAAEDINDELVHDGVPQWQITKWWNAPQPEFDGQSPIELFQRHDAAALAELARTIPPTT